MKNLLFVIVMMFVFSGVGSAQEREVVVVRKTTSTGIQEFHYMAGEVLVRPKDPVTWRKKTGTKCDAKGLCYMSVQAGTDARALSASAEALAANTEEILSATLSPVSRARQAPMPLTNDPLLPYQWQLVSSLPGALGGWIPYGKKPSHVYFASTDSGGCQGHEDFDWSRNWWNYDTFHPEAGFQAVPFDNNGHGCATSGLALAINNNKKGIAGLAEFANFAYVKFLDSKGNGDVAHTLDGLLKLLDQYKKLPPGSRLVVLMSWGFDEVVPEVDEVIKAGMALGIEFVAAADNLGNNNNLIHSTPASVPGVIVVGACDTKNGLVNIPGYFVSGYGNKVVTTCAPGVEIVTTVPTPLESVHYQMSDISGYKRVDGTSFAAAIVAGAIARLLGDCPKCTHDEILTRLKNGNRNIQPVNIWNRVLAGPDLFQSGASLSLPNFLADATLPPAQPYLQVVAGAGSARVTVLGTDTPFGVRCFYGDIANRKVWEAIPNFAGQNVLLVNQDSTPLPENTLMQVACQVVDGTGNWSPVSQAVTFTTLRSSKTPLELGSFTVQHGLLWDLIQAQIPNPPILWNWAQFPLLGCSGCWYAGDPRQVSYASAGLSDSMLESQDIALPVGSAWVELGKYSQKFPRSVTGASYDVSEISVVWIDDSGAQHEEVVVEDLPNNLTLGPELYKLDLSRFAGKTVRLRLRFFTNGSTVGIGTIYLNVSLFGDAAQ